MSEVITYENIWQTLVKVDVSKHVEKKNGLTYLSWAWAWGVLMEEFPNATYEFDPHEIHNDGTVTVHCTVRIGPCYRSMWLPVMDYKNNAIKNPDARKISDTRMRCLVKCISMLGLGHGIYAGEDIQSAPVQTDQQIQQSVAELDEGPLIDETPAVKQKRKVPTKQGPNDIPSEEGAAEIVEKLLQFAKQFCKDTNSLRGFWSENKQLIDILDSNYPKQYEALKTAFIELKSKYEGATSNG